MVVFGVANGAGPIIAAGAAGLIGTAYLSFGLYRDDRAKRKFNRADRLRVIDRLLERRLVSESEADELRSQLTQAFPSDSS